MHIKNSIDLQDPREISPQVVGTGATHLMMPVLSRGAVDLAKPDADRLTKMVRQVGAQGVCLFAVDA